MFSATPVKTRYQSMQGVTRSIIKATKTSGRSLKKSQLSPKANRGVHRKLIIKLSAVTFLFKNAFFKFLMGTCRKTPNNMIIKKGIINNVDRSAARLNCPKLKPNKMAIIINNH